MDQEQWKPVVGFENRYEVSSQGRVRNAVRGRVLKPAPTSRGYLTVQLYDGSRPKKPRSYCVHDLVMAAFVGPKPQGYQVDHGDKGKQCNALDNLEYVTPAENIRRFVQTGKRKRYYGSDHANAKLTAEQVRQLRRLLAEGELHTSWLASEFGVSRSTVFDAARGRTYKNVADFPLAV
jgi:hypothetical protein